MYSQCLKGRKFVVFDIKIVFFITLISATN
jgi:hypothetical protein